MNIFLKLTTKQMMLISFMTAILCILSPISFTMPFSPIPFSFATLGIYFTLILLGGKLGTLSVLLYILLGLFGLPVFSGFSGGIGKLFSPTGGYLIGYLFLSIIFGFFLDKWNGKFLPAFFGILLGTCICYLFGTLWFSKQASLSFFSAFIIAVLPYLPGDGIKIFLAFTIGTQIKKRLSKTGFLSNNVKQF